MLLSRTGIRVAALVLLLCAGAALSWRLHVSRLEGALLRAEPDRAVSDPTLVNFALGRAPSLYARHCASCHGDDMRGSPSMGTPDLSDSKWLYGWGELPDIEETVAYGIRSGHPMAHNVTDMPALGRVGQLSAPEIHDVVEYVYGTTHPDADPLAAQRGRALFMDKGSCYDCHGAEGRGNFDYGAPDLTGHPSWIYGGDRQTLYRSVYDGRHGLCPAWMGQLGPAQVRELAIFLYITAHRAAPPPPHPTGAS